MTARCDSLGSYPETVGEGALRRVDADEIDRAVVEPVDLLLGPALQNLRELRIASVVIADEFRAPGAVTGNRVTARRQA